MISLGIPIAIVVIFLILRMFGKFTCELRKLRVGFLKRHPKITELPIITSTGQIVNCVEDLDLHLDFLRGQLEEKEEELESSRSKISSTGENLKKLTDTTNEVRKYYLKLKSEINKTENECKQLKIQIEDYKLRQTRLREEVNENVKYYTDLLSDLDSGKTGSKGDCSQEFEMVKKFPRDSKFDLLNRVQEQ
ncbi:unnamed protein product [Phaedon cochleariae]|uniref:Uncharacterized protein n=1 Tax=Phaedon cochleariae TaxID=80249 RepID=A0A9P0DIL9_PHACE|nr:unnamed protein product [Phaedon cochleariae]